MSEESITDQASPIAKPGGVLKRLKKIIFRLLVFIGSLALATTLIIGLFPEPTLGWLVQRWEVEHPVQKADAIFVPGGGSHFRPQHAAKLRNEHLAPVILLTSSNPPAGDVVAIAHHHKNSDQFILLSLGISASDTITLDAEVTSTWDEAWAVREWVIENEAKTVIISTDRFHSRRVCWVMKKVVEDETGCHCLISISPWLHYQTDDWWKNPWGRESFIRELYRMAFYKLYYSWKM